MAEAHAIRTHKRLSASGAERWVNCTGSIKLAEGMPNVRHSTYFASRGTVMHEVGEEALLAALAKDILADGIGNPYDLIGNEFTSGDHNVEFDLEMAEAVDLYVQTIMADCKAAGEHLLVVEKIFDKIEFLHPDFGGMNDACLISYTYKKCTIYDFKGGKGVFVPVERNYQLMYYGVGALIEYWDELQGIDEFELVIVQPGKGEEPVRRWTTSRDELLDYLFNTLLPAAIEVNGDSLKLVPGKWCNFCPAIRFCPAKTAEVNKLLDATEKLTEEMDANLMSAFLRRFSGARSFAARIEERMKLILSLGGQAPGWALEAKRGHREWANELGAELALRLVVPPDPLKPNQIYNQKLVSPAQAQKLVGKKLYDTALKHLVTVAVNGYNLTWTGSVEPAKAESQAAPPRLAFGPGALAVQVGPTPIAGSGSRPLALPVPLPDVSGFKPPTVNRK